MVYVNSTFRNYGDFQLNKITDTYTSNVGEEEIVFYNLYSVDFGYIGTYKNEIDAHNAMINIRSMARVYASMESEHKGKLGKIK